MAKAMREEKSSEETQTRPKQAWDGSDNNKMKKKSQKSPGINEFKGLEKNEIKSGYLVC